MNRILKIMTAVALFSFSSSFSTTTHAQDAEYNLIRKHYTVNDDGTVDIRYRKELKLLRNRAITAYADKGETFILYNPAIDQLTINESYTIRKDGSRVQTPANAFIDQLPSQCENCGRYNGIRERVVVHTALEYDCIIVLDYTIRRKTDYVTTREILNQDCPVKRYEFIVDIAKSKQNNLISFVYDGNGAKVKSLNDGHTYHIVATQLPQTYVDRYLPAPEQLYAHVEFTYGHRYVSDSQYDNDKLPEAENLITELFENDKVAYMTHIRDYVVDNIITNNIPEELTGYSCATPSETFRSNCGTPADKRRLAVALLNQAGFVARLEGNTANVSLTDAGTQRAYRLSLNDKSAPLPIDADNSTKSTINVNQDLIWSGVSLGATYNKMTLPSEAGAFKINITRLAPSRKAPLQVRNVNEKYHYTIMTSRTPKKLLVNPIDIQYTKKGIGTIRICIKQLSNGLIDVVRELELHVDNNIVTPKQYKDFRQMMLDWNQYNSVIIRSDLGRPIMGN